MEGLRESRCHVRLIRGFFLHTAKEEPFISQKKRGSA
jgi:hypothetical protein